VVVDNEMTSREQVVLAHEKIGMYDPDYYGTELARAVESVLSCWTREYPSGALGDVDARDDNVHGTEKELTNIGIIDRRALVNRGRRVVYPHIPYAK